LLRIRFSLNSDSEIKYLYKLVKSIRFSNYFGAEVNYDFTQRLQFKVNGKLVSENVVGIDNEIE